MKILIHSRNPNESNGNGGSKQKKPKYKIYPTLKFQTNQTGQNQLEFSLYNLMQHVVNEAQLKLLNFPNDPPGISNGVFKQEKSKFSNRQELFAYFAKTRERLLRMLALLRWARKHHQQYLELRSNLQILNVQSNSYTQCADLLYFVDDQVKNIQEPLFDIPASIDYLGTKTSRLPEAIKLTSEANAFSQEEVDAALDRLTNSINLHLLKEKLPNKLEIVKVENGKVLLRYPHEFEILLTLIGRNPPHWHILYLQLLVNAYGVEVNPLVLKNQRKLIQILQTRLTGKVSPDPIVDCHNSIHRVCTRIALDILCVQASNLQYSTFKGVIESERSDDAKNMEIRQTISYWKDSPSYFLINSEANQLFPVNYGQISIVIDKYRDLVITHTPSIKGDEDKLILSQLNLSLIISKRIRKHSNAILEFLYRYLESNLRENIEIRNGKLFVPIIEAYSLVFQVDWRSGRMILELVCGDSLITNSRSRTWFVHRNFPNEPLLELESYQKRINENPTIIKQVVNEIRGNVLLYTYKRAAYLLGLGAQDSRYFYKIRDRLDNHGLQKLKNNPIVYIRYPIDEHHNLVVSLKESQSNPIIEFHLLLPTKNKIILHQNLKFGQINSNQHFEFESFHLKRRKLSLDSVDSPSFSTSVSHLRWIMQKTKIAIVRHSLLQQMASRDIPCTQAEMDQEAIYFSYPLPNRNFDHKNTKLYLKVHDSHWEIKMDISAPSIFEVQREIPIPKFSKYPSIEILDIPNGHEIIFRNRFTDNINQFLEDLMRLDIMSALKRQTQNIPQSNDFYSIKTCHFTGMLIEYGGTYLVNVEASKVKSGKYLLTFFPRHELSMFIGSYFNENPNLVHLLQMLERISLPILKLHEGLSKPKQYWYIVPRTISQFKLIYRGAIEYVVTLKHDMIQINEKFRSSPENNGGSFSLSVRNVNQLSQDLQNLNHHAFNSFIFLTIKQLLSANRTKSYISVTSHNNREIKFSIHGFQYVLSLFDSNVSFDLTNEPARTQDDPGLNRTLQQYFAQVSNPNPDVDTKHNLVSFWNLICSNLNMLKLPELMKTESNQKNILKLHFTIPYDLKLPNSINRFIRDCKMGRSAIHLQNDVQFFYCLIRCQNRDHQQDYIDIPIKFDVKGNKISIQYYENENAPDTVHMKDYITDFHAFIQNQNNSQLSAFHTLLHQFQSKTVHEIETLE